MCLQLQVIARASCITLHSVINGISFCWSTTRSQSWSYVQVSLSPGMFHLILQKNSSCIVIYEFLTLSWALVIGSNLTIASVWATCVRRLPYSHKRWFVCQSFSDLIGIKCWYTRLWAHLICEYHHCIISMQAPIVDFRGRRIYGANVYFFERFTVPSVWAVWRGQDEGTDFPAYPMVLRLISEDCADQWLRFKYMRTLSSRSQMRNIMLDTLGARQRSHRWSFRISCMPRSLSPGASGAPEKFQQWSAAYHLSYSGFYGCQYLLTGVLNDTLLPTAANISLLLTGRLTIMN